MMNDKVDKVSSVEEEALGAEEQAANATEQESPAESGAELHATDGPEQERSAVETAELEALYTALAAERRKAEEYLGQLQRLKADFENYRRRMNHEQARWQEQAAGQVLLQILPVLDNLERAVASSGKADAEILRQGLDLTLRQFRETLEKLGVQPIEAIGRPFDPNRHEAMMREESCEVEEDTVIGELQKGYAYKGQVLRPALVKVAVRG